MTPCRSGSSRPAAPPSVPHVDPQGKVQRVELVSATPPEAYDSAMEAAFSQWTFDPPGVAGRMTVDIDIVPPTG